MNAKTSTKKNSRDDQSTNDYQFETGLVSIRRTAKVVKGGRIFRFSATVVVGDGDSQVGIGIGHGLEVPTAIQKAEKQAKQSMRSVSLTRSKTIQHALFAKHGATRVFMRPAAEGTGIIAGGAMRIVLKAVGVKNVLAKIYGSQCAQNVAYATVKGLLDMYTRDAVFAKRRKQMSHQSPEELTHE